MNCKTCCYELSECLDGRLPSGRRAKVMEHAESCPSCGSFWRELQEAQQLTLSLRNGEVRSEFKTELWERIHSGEGTPNAVFQETVPLLSKVRYTLTGAAAAAMLLIGITMWQSNAANNISSGAMPSGAEASSSTPITSNTRQPSGNPQVNDVASQTLRPRLPIRQQLASHPLISSAKPLTVELLAVETARQLELRYETATIGIRMMQSPEHNQDFAINQVLDSADELRDFGELLLDLRDRQRLFFTDVGIDADLQFAVSMLGQAASSKQRTAQTVETFVAPALRSNRLSRVSHAISLKPTNEQEQLRDLMQLNTQRPEVFPKLFFVLGSLEEVQRNYAMMRPGMAIFLENGCDGSWVAPRSEVSLNGLRHSFGEQSQMRVQIEVHTERR